MVLIVDADRAGDRVSKIIAGHMHAIESGIRRYDEWGNRLAKPVPCENNYTVSDQVQITVTPIIGQVILMKNGPMKASDLSLFKHHMEVAQELIGEMDDSHTKVRRPYNAHVTKDHVCIFRLPDGEQPHAYAEAKAPRAFFDEAVASDMALHDANAIFKWVHGAIALPIAELTESVPTHFLLRSVSTIIVHYGVLRSPNGTRMLNYPQLDDYMPIPNLFARRIRFTHGPQPMNDEVAVLNGAQIPESRIDWIPWSVVPWHGVKFLRRVHAIDPFEQLKLPFDFDEQEQQHKIDVEEGKEDTLRCFLSGLPLFGYVLVVTAYNDDVALSPILVNVATWIYRNKRAVGIQQNASRIDINLTICPVPVEAVLPHDIDPRHKKIITDITKYGAIYSQFDHRNQCASLRVVNPETRTVSVGCARLTRGQLMLMSKYDTVFMI
jgi:hypothetical protein